MFFSTDAHAGHEGAPSLAVASDVALGEDEIDGSDNSVASNNPENSEQPNNQEGSEDVSLGEGADTSSSADAMDVGSLDNASNDTSEENSVRSAAVAFEDIDLTNPTSGTGYTYNGSTTLTFDAGASENTYRIWQSGSTAITNIIINNAQNTELVLDNINMTSPAGQIDLSGTANILLLLEGVNRVGNSIVVETGQTLTIDSASAPKTGSVEGELIVTASARNAAGIGGLGALAGAKNAHSSGTIIIDGGTISATAGEASLTYGGAGIGGGYNSAAGTTIINGGHVNATGTGNAAGIGGGGAGVNRNYASGGVITINGGTIVARSGPSSDTRSGGAAIGGGSYGGGGKITINGGEVTAITLNANGAGIGSGAGTGASLGTGTETCEIVINNGTVEATSVHGAAIGGGARTIAGVVTDAAAGTIEISGGTVNATATGSGAGIGGGGTTIYGPVSMAGGSITITGGTISATGGVRGGAGIGSGGSDMANAGAGGAISITGGTIVALGNGNGAGIGGGGTLGDYVGGEGGTINIGGGEVNASSQGAGAGIGGGGSGGNRAGGKGSTTAISITGGAVNATATGRGAGIGGGGSVGSNVYAIGGAGGTIAISDTTEARESFVFAISLNGAGIGGGQGQNAGAAASLELASSANVKAYASGGQGKPAIDINGINTGSGFFVNARFDSAPSTEELVLYTYASGTMSSESRGAFSLPAQYRCFAYSTGATQEQVDHIRVEDDASRVVMVTNSSQHMTSSKSADVLEVKLVAYYLQTPTITDLTGGTATLHSNGQYLSPGLVYLSGGIRYSLSSDMSNPVADISWNAFSEEDITADISDLTPGAIYYVQTYITVEGSTTYVSGIASFKEADVINLSTTTTNGAGYIVGGTSPNRTLTFTTAANNGNYRIVQDGSGISGSERPKQGTSIFYSIIFSNTQNVAITIDGIDIIGGIILQPTAKVDLSLTGSSYISGGIVVPSTATITIDSASTPGSTDGSLTVTATQIAMSPGSNANAAGIGGGGTPGAGTMGGTIIIKGGTIDATGGPSGSAGIGGGAAIGGGSGYSAARITIEGGMVTARPHANSVNAAAIGGGSTAAGGIINITGGTVVATGSQSGAAIGGGYNSLGGTITITGGTITATAGLNGAAIGGGDLKGGGTITITGGTITATAGLNGTAIGSGNTGTGLSNITIESGTITATAGLSGAAIGGGRGAAGGTIVISGGEVEASSVDGAAIGGGVYTSGVYNPYAIDITGGTVVAMATGSGTGIGHRVGTGTSTRYGAFTLDTSARVVAYATGAGKPAIDVSPTNSTRAYYVNARFDTASAKDLTLYAYAQGDIHTTPTLLNLSAGYHYFAYSTGSTTTQSDGIYIYENDVLTGTLVRSIDDNSDIYSINTSSGYNVHNNNAGDGVLPVKYELRKTVDFLFYQVDKNREPLSGVSFTLYACPQGSSHNHSWLAGKTDNCWQELLAASSDAQSGMVRFSGLVPGDYMLVETATLPDYQLPAGQWFVKVDAALEITITAHGLNEQDTTYLPPAFIGEGMTTHGDSGWMLPNYQKMVLPLTGGTGMFLFPVIGIVLLAEALIILLLPRRKKREQVTNIRIRQPDNAL